MRKWQDFLKRVERKGWYLESEDDHMIVFSNPSYTKGNLYFTGATQEQILETIDDANYEMAFEFTLKWEGEKSYDKYGGETYFGITKRYFPKQYTTISKMEQVEDKVKYAKEFYKKNFWDKYHCNEVDYPLDILIFDTAVNIPKAIKKGYKVLSDLSSQEKSAIVFLTMRIFEYLKRVNKNKGKRKFLRGWLNRCKSWYDKFIKEKNDT